MPSPYRWLFKRLGPGFITGASDNDPSGIATYTQVGAQFGLGQIWTALLCLPCMIAIQEMCARIGMVAGSGVTAVLRRRYPKWVLLLFIWSIICANTINIGADLGAMADAAHLLLPAVSFPALAIFFTVLTLVLEVFVTYRAYANILKWLAMSLLSYVAAAFLVTNNWQEVIARAIIPNIQLNRDYVLGLVAVLGTTISPYLFIWQSDEEVEEEVALGRTTVRSRRGATNSELRNMRADTAFGMGFSQLVTFFIISTAASTFFRHGLFDIQTTTQAAQALEPLAGRFAALLYTAGIIGTGLLAIPVLSASASYALAESYHWSEGLYKKFNQAHGFYGIITLATLLGLLINFLGINPIKALIWAAVINGLVAPISIAIILFVANNRQVMGKRVNGTLANVVGGFTLLLMTAAGALLFVL